MYRNKNNNMPLNLPRVSHLLYAKNDNEIWQYFSGETILNNFQVISLNPFTVEANGINYLVKLFGKTICPFG
jgi:hypothetical protein